MEILGSDDARMPVGRRRLVERAIRPRDEDELEARPVGSVADLLSGEVGGAAVRGAADALFVRRVWVS